MREIKFRAWDKINKDMLPKAGVMDGKVCVWEDGPWGELGFSEAIPMQYTGLRDKNGKEIYEGDIVTGHTSYESNNDEMEWTREKPIVVEWNETEAGFRPFTYNNRWRCDVVNIEVIGNIYEHPSLLQEEKGKI